MGFFGKLLGSPDSEVMSSPLVGRGEVIDVQASGVAVKVGGSKHDRSNVQRKCTIKLRVMLDGQLPYEAQCVQRLTPAELAKPIVAVRVDPKDRSKVAIDFSIPVPVVTLARNEGRTGATWILANGKPITVVLIGHAPLGIRSADGHDAYLIALTVATGVPTPYQTKVANAVPATALPLLYPGSRLHAMLGDGPENVVVDWSKGAA